MPRSREGATKKSGYRLRVLVVTEHYLPGYRAGGPIVSVANLVDTLGKEISFFVLTSAWDVGARARYRLGPNGPWRKVGLARVRYLSRSVPDLWLYVRLLMSPKWDVVYLNSFFARQFSMVPIMLRRLGLLKCRRIVLAPRGAFSFGAMGIKSRRKSLYCRATNRLGLYRGITWQASTEREAADIVRRGLLSESIHPGVGTPGTSRMEIVPNLAVASDLAGPSPAPALRAAHKEPGSLVCAFVSRICRMKNLAMCADILSSAMGNVHFRIAGPMEDRPYWDECVRKLSCLPRRVTWEYLGAVSPAEVREIFRSSHLFVFPTHGENFGHVIVEALSSGCPVLTTDQTPWVDLEAGGAGWALPKQDIAQFRSAVDAMIGLDAEAFQTMSEASRAYIEHHPVIESAVEANRKLFTITAMRPGV